MNDAERRLKKVREKIQAILKDNDVAGVVQLHAWSKENTAVGYGEFFALFDTSYSLACVEDGRLRIRSLRQDYYSAEEQAEALNPTVNMLVVLRDLTALNFANLGKSLELLKEQAEIEEGAPTMIYDHQRRAH